VKSILSDDEIRTDDLFINLDKIPVWMYILIKEVMGMHNKEDVFRFEPKSKCQYHLSSSVRISSSDRILFTLR
jgi:hypothetical protein